MSLAVCYGKALQLDQACLQLKNNGYYDLQVSNVTSECYECIPQHLTTISESEAKTFIVSTIYSSILEFKVRNETFRDTYSFEQHGNYQITWDNDKASLEVLSQPDSAYTPLWFLVSTLALCTLMWTTISYALATDRVRRLIPSLSQQNVVIRDAAEEDLGGASSRSRSGDSTPLVTTPPIQLTEGPKRTVALDVFRGITITLMMFVNYGGGKYAIFEHSAWNGLTFADVVFPWFAWIMGVGLALAIHSLLRNAVPRKKILMKVLLRSLILIALGIVLNSFKNNNIHHLRIPGVLQRLGLAYLIVGTLETLLLKPQDLGAIVLLGRRELVYKDIKYAWKQWVVMVSIVVVHTCVVLFVKIDGCPRGYLGPGGLDREGVAANCTGGVTGFLDRWVFTPNHIYPRPTSAHVYESPVPFDPEGLLGTLTTAFTVFLGAHAAHILLVHSSTGIRNLRLLVFSFVCAMVTFALISTSSKDAGVIPINKNLWSLSFVTTTCSLAYIAFTVLYTVVDDKRWWCGSPFKQVGRNAIIIYVGHIITKNACPWNWSPVDHTSHAHILLMNTWSTLLWIVIAIIMDHCNCYITI